MKKIIKILSIIIIAFILLSSITSTVYAAQDPIPKPEDYTPVEEEMPKELTDMASTIATIIQTIGVVLSVIILLLLGIKYMMGSVEEKAAYKKSLIPFLVGTVFIAATGSIMKLIIDLTSQTFK